MHQRPFQQVDVFTDQPYRGNPLAVVLDGTGLSTEAMQQFTNWTNLSEATFVLPPSPEARAAGDLSGMEEAVDGQMNKDLAQTAQENLAEVWKIIGIGKK